MNMKPKMAKYTLSLLGADLIINRFDQSGITTENIQYLDEVGVSRNVT
jgi:hypothetical protein